MHTKSYTCPSCGAPLAFEGEKGKLCCAACGNDFDADTLDDMERRSNIIGVHFEKPRGEFGEGESGYMRGYTCKNCGAALMIEATTTATACPYCASPAIIQDNMEGSARPDKVVPFVVTKEQAQRQFHDYFKGKRLLPNVFLQGQNRIADMRRLFVPYWLFDCEAEASILYDAERTTTECSGDEEITTTEHFLLHRSGSMAFEGIPVDGSAKLDDGIAESLEPYDMSAAIPFEPAVLAGSMAEGADVDSEACQSRARERVASSMASALRDTVTGYTGVTERSRYIKSENGRVVAALMPVWLITTEREGRTYTFAINGQTGKLTCDVTADGRKSLAWGGGVFLTIIGFAALIMALTDSLTGGALFMAGMAALIAALMALGILQGQLKRATKQSAASKYVRSGSFQLGACSDRLLYADTKRRAIPSDADKGEKG